MQVSLAPQPVRPFTKSAPSLGADREKQPAGLTRAEAKGPAVDNAGHKDHRARGGLMTPCTALLYSVSWGKL